MSSGWELLRLAARRWDRVVRESMFNRGFHRFVGSRAYIVRGGGAAWLACVIIRLLRIPGSGEPIECRPDLWVPRGEETLLRAVP